MAREGVRFTDFYGENVCTPARASLLTGAYAKRVGLHVGVLPPESKDGLHPDEVMLAELLKTRGYATACIGKWHLGSSLALLPTAEGFESYFDMPGPNHGRSDLYRGTELITKNADLQLDQLTLRYTKLRPASSANPRTSFFLYLAHSTVHIPLFASGKVSGAQPRGNVWFLVQSEEKQTTNSGIITYPVGGQVVDHRCTSIDPEEIPPIPRFKGEAIPLPDGLRSSLLEAFPCASHDVTRYVVTGAYVDVSRDDGHYVVGTNGRILYSSNSFKLPLKESLNIPPHKFVGWKGVQQRRRLAAQNRPAHQTEGPGR
jgi:hypothetical protein